MFKIKILTEGKTKEPWLKLALEEYTKRLGSTIEISWHIAKNEEQLADLALKEKDLVALDPKGAMLTSEEFTRFLFQRLEASGSRLTLLIGAAEGLPQTIRDKFPMISLSKMTFTHQMTRLILLEQIYRAVEIEKGSGYHK